MKFSTVCLESLEYIEPPEIWSTDNIEQQLAPLYKRLKLPYGRLELMTGIQERKFWHKNINPSDASALAGKKALINSNFKTKEIDLLVHCSVCRDRLEPATASYVHHKLKLSNECMTFDISNACLGFLNAMSVASGMIESGNIKRALIVSGENGKPLLENTIKKLTNSTFTRNEIKPYIANLTIGAGAVACILCHQSLADCDTPKLIGGSYETDSSYCNLCEGDTSSGGTGLEMQTDSEKLLNAGVKVAKQTWLKFKETTDWKESTIDRSICHQVGNTHRKKLYETLNLDLGKDYSTFKNWGNTGSASLPITLAKAIKEKKINNNDKVVLLGIGSGLTCMMLGIRY